MGKNENFIAGEVKDITRGKVKILLSGGRHESVKDEGTLTRGDEVAVELSNLITKNEDGFRCRAIKEITGLNPDNYAEYMNKITSSSKILNLPIDDFDALPELLQKAKNTSLSQVFFEVSEGDYDKKVPKYQGHPLRHIVFSREHDSFYLEFSFQKEGGNFLRFTLDELKKKLNKESMLGEGDLKLLKIIIPDLEKVLSE